MSKDKENRKTNSTKNESEAVDAINSREEKRLNMLPKPGFNTSILAVDIQRYLMCEGLGMAQARELIHTAIWLDEKRYSHTDDDREEFSISIERRMGSGEEVAEWEEQFLIDWKERLELESLRERLEEREYNGKKQPPLVHEEPSPAEEHPASQSNQVVWLYGVSDFAWLFYTLIDNEAIDCQAKYFAAHFVKRNGEQMPQKLRAFYSGGIKSRNQGINNIVSAINSHEYGDDKSRANEEELG